MRPVISYLIPSYNHAIYLPFLLEGISRDTRLLDVPVEVIIMDDGSQDNSKSVINSWAKANEGLFEIYCFFQENKGLSAVLNKMIDEAQGEYLRLCASDDVIIAGSTQLLYNEFKRQPNLRCVLADARVVDEKGDIIHESSIKLHGGNIKHLMNSALLVKELIQHWCVAGPTHLIKRSHYESMRYDESSKIDDFDLFLSLLEVPNAVAFINEFVCLYRVHSTNTSKTKNRERRLENSKFFLAIIDKYIYRCILAKYLSPLRYRSIAKIYFLQRKYLRSFFNMAMSLVFKVKSELQS